MVGTPDDQLLREPVRRVEAFGRLAEGPATRAELQEALDVSRTTLHRVVTTLVDADLAVEADGDVELTPLGREIAAAVTDYAERVATAERVAPLLNPIEPADLPVAMPADLFADADVLRPAPSRPQRPIQRIVDVVRAADRMRALVPVVLPTYVEVVADQIVDGMDCELLLGRGAHEGLVDSYDDRFGTALETGRLRVRVHDAVPFGLLLTGATVCVVAYDEEGVLRGAVEGDGDRLRAWAEDCYEHYWSAGDPYDPTEMDPVEEPPEN